MSPPTASTTTQFLSHFANLKLYGDRLVRDAIHALQADDPTLSTSAAMRTFFTINPSTNHTHPRRRRRPRRSRISTLSDADLEAELVARRAARARERERYAKAMRSEKLSLLEGELARLRSEIARIDHNNPNTSSSLRRTSGIPPNKNWQSLTRSSTQRSSSSRLTPPSLTPSAAPRPPPGPPPPPVAASDADLVDPERQKREKLERQKRREAKRKEREAARKPMTLADIIKSAGPDPVSRLKPSGSISVPDVSGAEEASDQQDKRESFDALRGSLKKVSVEKAQSETDQEKPKQTDSARAEGDSDDKGKDPKPDSATDAKSSTASDTKEAKSDSDVEKAVASTENRDDDPQSETPVAKPSSSPSLPLNPKPEAVIAATESGTPSANDIKPAHPDPPHPASDDAQKEGASSEAAEPAAPNVSKPGNPPNFAADEKTNGKENKNEMAASDALQAISALASSLPARKALPSTTKKTTARMSLREKRRLRRQSGPPQASSIDSEVQNQQGSNQQKLDTGDVLAAAADALKLD